MSRVLLPLAAGFEEIEAVTVIDVLRRAGIEVRTASLGARRVTGSHGITLEADVTLDEARAGDFDMIVLPGGMPGAENLKQDARVIALLAEFAASGRYTAAICAAPGVLAHAGLLAGRAATSFPGFLSQRSAPGIRLSADAVVTDGKVVTSRSAGTAMEFALELVELLAGAGKRGEVERTLRREGGND
jgi:4-methyl-5(b-hydroxyethyl)-thiazole monophosphate biosynthesis